MIAGIKGKDVREARGHEDSLTSALFGHLRYLRPGVFWTDLFAKTIDATDDERTLKDVLNDDANNVLKQCTNLKIDFWPNYEIVGEPDMILQFCNHANRALLTIVVEVKFHSGESGNQLARYMKLVTNPTRDARADYLIYLTPRESLNEINEAISADQDLEKFRHKLFRLQWQDVLEVAKEAGKKQSGKRFPYDTILADVATLLRKRGLEHFKGMQVVNALKRFDIKSAPWRGSKRSISGTDKDRRFNGMNESNDLEMFTIKKGAWNQ